MPSAFTLYGQLVADTGAFEKSLRAADDRLTSTRGQLSKTMQESLKLGDTSATVARRYEKLNEAITANRERLNEASSAYAKGEINARKYASVLAQVERATSSVNSRLKDASARVTEIGETGATHFQNQIKGATSAISNLSAIFTGNRLSGATTEISAVGNALTAIDGPAGLATAAIATTATAAVGLGAALFALEVRASEYGSKIHDAAQQTGLTTEAISTLKFAADNSGSSLEQVTTGLARFAKTVGAAGDGSKEAAAKLKDLGVNPQSALADLDGSLDQVFKRIAEAKPGIEQITLAQKAFGKSGADLIPVILQAGGSLAEYRKHAEALGLTLSQDAADAADNFGDTLGQVKAQAENAAATFALQFAPQITKALESVSAFLADSKGSFAEWGKSVANVFSSFEALSNLVPSGITKIISSVDALKAALLLLGGPLAIALELLGDLGDKYNEFLGDPEKQAAQDKKYQDRNKRILQLAASQGNQNAANALKQLNAASPSDELPDIPSSISAPAANKSVSDRLKDDLDKLDARRKAYIDNYIKPKQDAIQQSLKAETSSIASNYKIQEALLAQHLTAQQSGEIAASKATTALKNAQLRDEINANQKYYNELIANSKDAAEAEKFRVEGQTIVSQKLNEIRANEIKLQTETIAKTREAGNAFKDLLAGIQAQDNPFVRIFHDAEAAIDSAKKKFADFPELFNKALGAINNQSFGQFTDQHFQNKLASFGLLEEADQFRRGSIDSPQITNLKNLLNTPGLSQFDTNALNQRLKLTENAELQQRLEGQLKAINAYGDIDANTSQNGFLAQKLLQSDPEYQKRLDRQIISLTNGLDPSRLTRGENELAAAARTREAGRKDEQEEEAFKFFKNFNSAFKDGLPVQVKSGQDFVIIKNEAPDNATVKTNRGTPADTNYRYPQ